MGTIASQGMRAEWGWGKGIWVKVGGSSVNDLVLLRELCQATPSAPGASSLGLSLTLVAQLG